MLIFDADTTPRRITIQPSWLKGKTIYTEGSLTTRGIALLDKKTGKRYSSLAEVAKKLGISHARVKQQIPERFEKVPHDD